MGVVAVEVQGMAVHPLTPVRPAVLVRQAALPVALLLAPVILLAQAALPHQVGV